MTQPVYGEDRSKIRIVRLFTPEACARLIETVEAHSAWGESYVYDHATGGTTVNPSARLAKVFAETQAPEVFQPYRASIVATLARFLGPDADPRFELADCEVVRYDPGGLYGAHRDAAPGIAQWRRHSIVCYLNEEFEEGGTAFPLHDQTLRPLAGQALVFPSHYYHSATTVVSGRKYVFVTFLGDATTPVSPGRRSATDR